VVYLKNIPKGIYTISIFHENDNNKLDSNFLGIQTKTMAVQQETLWVQNGKT
jgi:uncharacterized protein (DUF2141 family)